MFRPSKGQVELSWSESPSMVPEISRRERGHRIYVVSQFASAANRRLEHLLALEHHGYQTILVRQHVRSGTERLITHTRVESVRKPPNPVALLDRAGLAPLRRSLDRQFWFPTPTVIYARAAARWLSDRIAMDLAQGRQAAVVLTTPPHDLAVIAPGLRRRFPKLHLLIDWQDLWSDDAVYAAKTHPRWASRVRSAEQDAIRAASVNVVTNPKAAARLTEILHGRGGQGNRTVIAIPHAFDAAEEEIAEEAFRQNAARRRDWPRRLRLAFVGNLFKPPKVPGDRLVSALAALQRSGVDLEMMAIGDKTLERDRALASRCGFPLTALDRRPHLDAMRIAGEADWLVLLLGRTRTSEAIMHAKLPMYLILGVPILAIAPHDSYAADVIAATGSGFVVDPDADLETGIGRILSQPPPRRARFEDVSAIVRNFDLPHQHALWLTALQSRN